MNKRIAKLERAGGAAEPPRVIFIAAYGGEPWAALVVGGGGYQRGAAEPADAFRARVLAAEGIPEAGPE